jgi:hypothetical protein
LKNLSGYFVLLCVVVGLSSCTNREKGKQATGDPADVLRANLGAFARMSKVRIFDRENLWEFIDGAAEGFLSYDFQKVATADYGLGDSKFTVEVYLFADPLGAFGIYAENRSPDDSFLQVGNEGFIGPGNLLFYKGRHFVRIDWFEQDLSLEAMTAVGTMIDGFLEGNTGPLSEIARFPEQGYVAHSERLLPSGFLGCEDLAWVLTAKSQTDAGYMTLFYFHDRSGLEKIRFCLLKRRINSTISDSPYKAVTTSNAGQEIILADQTNDTCFGVISSRDSPEMNRLLSDFASAIRTTP